MTDNIMIAIWAALTGSLHFRLGEKMSATAWAVLAVFAIVDGAMGWKP